MMLEQTPRLSVSSLDAVDPCRYAPDGSALRASLATSPLVLLPQEGYPNTALPFYPEGTTELWRLLRNTPGLEGAELGVEDDDFRTIARHAGDVFLPVLFIAGDGVVQITLNVIAAYIYDRIKFALPKATPQVHSEIYVKRTKSTSIVHLRYDGPAATYEKMVGDALKEAMSKDG